MARHRGRPIVTLRLDSGTIAALRMCANNHGLTVSDLLRQLIEAKLREDGISTSSKPIDGQISM